MKSCPECSGKVPETYEECPFCGCRFDLFSEPDPCFEPAFPAKVKAQPEEESGCLKRFFLEILIFIILLLVVGIVILATDFNGSRTELRRICMTDSGDGSERDSQELRIRVKYYILVFLDFFDHGGTGASIPTNSNAFDRKPHMDNSAKTETSVVQEAEKPLPPPPPKVEELDFLSEKPTAKNRGDANAPDTKMQELP